MRHDPARDRFVVEIDGALAQLLYRLEPGQVVIEHTRVPDELSGRGIGGALVRAALAWAAAERLTVVPWCPFTRQWLLDHPDVVESLTIDWSTPPATR